MSDLEHLIEHLTKYNEWYLAKTGDVAYKYPEIIDYLRQLKAAKERITELEQEWVLVDDKPIENGNYLCLVRSFGEFYQTELESYTCPEYGNQFWQTPLDGEDFESGEVMYYRALPPQPKE